jgi:hypothetical protein
MAASNTSPKSMMRPKTEKAFVRWARSMLARVKRESDEADSDDERKQRNDFYSQYFGCLMLPGPGIEDRVKAIERFVLLQCVPHTGARYVLHYHSPLFPNGVSLYVSHWKDIDCWDVQSIVETDVIDVWTLGRATWSPERMKELLRHIEVDFDYDGVTPQLVARKLDNRSIEIGGDWVGEG